MRKRPESRKDFSWKLVCLFHIPNFLHKDLNLVTKVHDLMYSWKQAMQSEKDFNIFNLHKIYVAGVVSDMMSVQKVCQFSHTAHTPSIIMFLRSLITKYFVEFGFYGNSNTSLFLVLAVSVDRSLFVRLS